MKELPFGTYIAITDPMVGGEERGSYEGINEDGTYRIRLDPIHRISKRDSGVRSVNPVLVSRVNTEAV